MEMVGSSDTYNYTVSFIEYIVSYNYVNENANDPRNAPTIHRMNPPSPIRQGVALSMMHLQNVL